MQDYYSRKMEEARSFLGDACVECGAVDRLEFDHIDPSTKRCDVSSAWKLPHAKFMEEVMKCQLLCAPCHERKTLRDRGQRSARGTHGTLSAYRYCGPPKCEPCKAAKRENQRLNRSR